ncbi:hypothetical protein NPIL_402081 [Nephila pilipes]|uniref:Uncharacterized protein n=1 Tax=Nephila pilipes TaxID=299642 RepID=A0A8X6Q8E0_NEPPI|nr:hypothetical protein NPIL_402081 [Nephila pilipes]
MSIIPQPHAQRNRLEEVSFVVKQELTRRERKVLLVLRMGYFQSPPCSFFCRTKEKYGITTAQLRLERHRNISEKKFRTNCFKLLWVSFKAKKKKERETSKLAFF